MIASLYQPASRFNGNRVPPERCPARLRRVNRIAMRATIRPLPATNTLGAGFHAPKSELLRAAKHLVLSDYRTQRTVNFRYKATSTLTSIVHLVLCIGSVLWLISMLASANCEQRRFSGRRPCSVRVGALPTQNSAHQVGSANASCRLRCPAGSCGLRCPAPEHPAMG